MPPSLVFTCAALGIGLILPLTGFYVGLSNGNHIFPLGGVFYRFILSVVNSGDVFNPGAANPLKVSGN